MAQGTRTLACSPARLLACSPASRRPAAVGPALCAQLLCLSRRSPSNCCDDAAGRAVGLQGDKADDTASAMSGMSTAGAVDQSRAEPMHGGGTGGGGGAGAMDRATDYFVYDIRLLDRLLDRNSVLQSAAAAGGQLYSLRRLLSGWSQADWVLSETRVWCSRQLTPEKLQQYRSATIVLDGV